MRMALWRKIKFCPQNYSLNLQSSGDALSTVYPRDAAIDDYLEGLFCMNEEQLDVWWGMYPRLWQIAQEVKVRAIRRTDFKFKIKSCPFAGK